MIYDLKRSVDLRWLFNHRYYIHSTSLLTTSFILWWSCFLVNNIVSLHDKVLYVLKIWFHPSRFPCKGRKSALEKLSRSSCVAALKGKEVSITLMNLNQGYLQEFWPTKKASENIFFLYFLWVQEAIFSLVESNFLCQHLQSCYHQQ